MQKKLELAASAAELGPAVKQMHDAIGRLAQFVQGAGSKGTVTMELAARDFSYSLARIYAGTGKDTNDGFQTGNRRIIDGKRPSGSWSLTITNFSTKHCP